MSHFSDDAYLAEDSVKIHGDGIVSINSETENVHVLSNPGDGVAAIIDEQGLFSYVNSHNLVYRLQDEE